MRPETEFQDERAVWGNVVFPGACRQTRIVDGLDAAKYSRSVKWIVLSARNCPTTVLSTVVPQKLNAQKNKGVGHTFCSTFEACLNEYNKFMTLDSYGRKDHRLREGMGARYLFHGYATISTYGIVRE